MLLEPLLANILLRGATRRRPCSSRILPPPTLLLFLAPTGVDALRTPCLEPPSELLLPSKLQAWPLGPWLPGHLQPLLPGQLPPGPSPLLRQPPPVPTSPWPPPPSPPPPWRPRRGPQPRPSPHRLLLPPPRRRQPSPL